MNNKGFTLVELLATVVILGLVMGFGIYGVTSTINNSEARGEEIFIDKLSKVVDEYIDMYGSSFSRYGSTYTFDKCFNADCTNKYSVTAFEVKKSGNVNITINDLVSQKFLDKEEAINPANDKQCFSSKNPQIRIFRDSDYVYYYYINLKGSNTNCEIRDENGIISTLDNNLAVKVGLSS